ncbi:hypothetical protein [Allopusillimonas ginsengisoli]|uniref:hypothetical protein n=1 Tax=Allopusillimonas ginsengisoli TaxID=453575 RepID=UPI0010211831|nr:hypothetical protein [Allopusillimonas ginsengisoli]TEA78681.1 hypothetical protein ERE07_09815 [Allopusillimonas ginsengisoli]
MTTKTDEQERTAFETWAKGADMPLGMYNATDYTDGATQLSWDGWQAGRAAMRERPAMPADAEEDIEAAAKTLAECMDYPWEYMQEAGRVTMRENAQSVLNAARRRIEGE